ncbi:MAG: WG repeat-containing protein [Muribaculaceae bacterium]|nr:WG repeat-containing protein [Muribaculaceae bacterium]
MSQKKGEPVTIINSDGVVVKELDKIKAAQPFRNGFATIIDDNNNAGVVDIKGQIIVKPKFDRIFPASADGYMVVQIT